MKGSRRHKIIYRALYTLLRVPVKWIFMLECETVRPKSQNYLLLSNHNTDFDAFLLSVAFPQQMYFVASEHIFRLGVVSKIISFLQAPIARLKGKNDMATVREVLSVLKNGGNVCIFPEGRSTYNGESFPVADAAAKLARLCGAGLITYRLDGAYFSYGRWMKSVRRGPIRGYVVNEYTPQELKAMKVGEIDEAINRDLYVNAYDTQGKSPRPYRGKNLAQYLENVLYMCPACGNMGKLTSRGDKLSCACGYNVRYTPYGTLSGEDGGDARFPTVLQWDRWQSCKLLGIVEDLRRGGKNAPVFTDDNQSLLHYERKGKTSLLARGEMRAYLDRLEVGNTAMPYAQIHDMTTQNRNVLLFSDLQGRNYEVKSPYARSALKYEALYKLCKQMGED